MNLQETAFLFEQFDLMKLDKACNSKECIRLPSKEIIIEEVDVITHQKRPIVSLCLCNTHAAAAIQRAVEQLGRHCPPGKRLATQLYEIGYITY